MTGVMVQMQSATEHMGTTTDICYGGSRLVCLCHLPMDRTDVMIPAQIWVHRLACKAGMIYTRCVCLPTIGYLSQATRSAARVLDARSRASWFARAAATPVEAGRSPLEAGTALRPRPTSRCSSRHCTVLTPSARRWVLGGDALSARERSLILFARRARLAQNDTTYMKAALARRTSKT